MFDKTALLSLTFLATAYAQQVGSLTAETHPSLNIQQCSAGGSCETQSRSIVLDSNWRWTHDVSGSTNCYTGNEWDDSLCPDPDTCATNCAIDGADYEGTYGITASDSSLTLKFVTNGAYSTNIGSRVYLLEDDSNYQLFSLKNQEFTFDVDMSTLPCGLNGALYFVQMDADGGSSKYAGNAAGAAYGTGYCDAQCPHDIKWINGAANVQNWTASTNDVNSGTGYYGTCCSEMDVWEANSQATAYTPHACSTDGQTQCEGTDCGDDATGERYAGLCDKDGCDFNSYRMGDTTFMGTGMTVDTSSTITVVTQFITTDNTTTGALSEIRRMYIQNGVLIHNSFSTFDTLTEYNSITDDFCEAQKTLFGDENSFASQGGLSKMGDAFDAGMVLVMSLWDDHAVNMLWLDSDYPTDADASEPGVSRGSCATTSGVPSDVEAQSPDASVTFSNIKYGPIGSTYGYTSEADTGSSSVAASSNIGDASSIPSTTASTAADEPASTTAALVGSASASSPAVSAATSQKLKTCYV